MKVESSTVQKIRITGVKSLDPVNVYIEDFDVGRGRIVIECFGESWAHGWSAMGDDRIREFFLACDEHYLAGKLASGLESTVVDDEAIRKHAEAHVLRLRRDREIDADEARSMFSDIGELNSYSEFDHVDQKTMARIYGDEWWYSLPTKPNPKYEYLCRIIKTVQTALRQQQEAA